MKNKFKEFIKQYHSNIAFWLCLVVSLFLIIGGAITPPPFDIPSSSLQAVGLLLGWAVIGTLPNMINEIKNGKSLKIKHNDTEIEIESDKEED